MRWSKHNLSTLCCSIQMSVCILEDQYMQRDCLSIIREEKEWMSAGSTVGGESHVLWWINKKKKVWTFMCGLEEI